MRVSDWSSDVCSSDLPRFHGCAGAVWNGGEFSASMYKGGLKDVLHGEETASFTTFDAALRFTPVRSGGLLSGLEFDVPMQVGFLLSPASYKGMSAHVSVRFLLLVIGVLDRKSTRLNSSH